MQNPDYHDEGMSADLDAARAAASPAAASPDLAEPEPATLPTSGLPGVLPADRLPFVCSDMTGQILHTPTFIHRANEISAVAGCTCGWKVTAATFDVAGVTYDSDDAYSQHVASIMAENPELSQQATNVIKRSVIRSVAVALNASASVLADVLPYDAVSWCPVPFDPADVRELAAAFCGAMASDCAVGHGGLIDEVLEQLAGEWNAECRLARDLAIDAYYHALGGPSKMMGLLWTRRWADAEAMIRSGWDRITAELDNINEMDQDWP